MESTEYKWYHDQHGNMSSMRILAVWGATVGTILCLAGIMAMFLGLEGSAISISTGAGLFSLGELAKALQAQKGL
jgi:hypothetical protein